MKNEDFKKYYCFCDGGLGNRLIPLACTIAKVGVENIGIFWPENNWCAAPFGLLFEEFAPACNVNLKDINDLPLNFQFYFHELQVPITDGRELKNIFVEKGVSENAVFYSNRETFDLSFESISQSFSFLAAHIQSDIWKKVDEFVQEKQINWNNMVGFHLRSTDERLFDWVETGKAMENYISAGKRIFICSDNEDVEHFWGTRFGYDNVLFRLKDDFVEKFNKDEDWNSRITDDVGRSFPFNVKRSSQSVLDGFIDVLLLAGCPIKHGHNQSSFFRMSKYLENYVNTRNN